MLAKSAAKADTAANKAYCKALKKTEKKKGEQRQLQRADELAMEKVPKGNTSEYIFFVHTVVRECLRNTRLVG